MCSIRAAILVGLAPIQGAIRSRLSSDVGEDQNAIADGCLSSSFSPDPADLLFGRKIVFYHLYEAEPTVGSQAAPDILGKFYGSSVRALHIADYHCRDSMRLQAVADAVEDPTHEGFVCLVVMAMIQRFVQQPPPCTLVPRDIIES